jgi:hypothetical protein
MRKIDLAEAVQLTPFLFQSLSGQLVRWRQRWHESEKMLHVAFLPPGSPRPTRRFELGSGVTWSQKGASWRFGGDFVLPRVYSASTKGIVHTEKTAGEKTFDTL